MGMKDRLYYKDNLYDILFGIIPYTQFK